MAARLAIQESAYVLSVEQDGIRQELAFPEGGASSLLAPRRSVDEGGLERAIEIAEDWLMPHAFSLRGAVLQVHDTTGRLTSGLEHVLSESARTWRLDEFERLFLRLVDLALGRHPPVALQSQQAFTADILLIRELSHHGQVQEIRLM